MQPPRNNKIDSGGVFCESIHSPKNEHNPQGDQRLPHDSGKRVAVDDLSRLGVLYYHIPDVEGVDELAAERGYKNRDEITVSPEKMGAVYEDKVKMFFAEHLHEDEEIRYIRDGYGYFDVRSKGDDWIRIHLEKVSKQVLLWLRRLSPRPGPAPGNPTCRAVLEVPRIADDFGPRMTS